MSNNPQDQPAQAAATLSAAASNNPTNERDAVLAAATAAARADLDQNVTLVPGTVNVSGDWAFVYATLRSAQGGEVDYAGTQYAEAAANGGRSQQFVALLKHDGGRWITQRHDAGPTDAAWLGWTDAGAPESIYAIDD